MVNSERQRGENYADSIFNLFGGSDFLTVEIDPAFRDYAIEALQDHGCIVQHERDSLRVVIYLQGNRQNPALAEAFHLA